MCWVMKKLSRSDVPIDCWIRGNEAIVRSLTLGIAPTGSRPLIR